MAGLEPAFNCAIKPHSRIISLYATGLRLDRESLSYLPLCVRLPISPHDPKIRKKVWGRGQLRSGLKRHRPSKPNPLDSKSIHRSRLFFSPNKDKNFFKSCQVFLNIFLKKVGATFYSRKSGAYKRERGDGRFRSVAPKGDTNWCMS